MVKGGFAPLNATFAAMTGELAFSENTKVLVVSDYRPTVGARPEAEIFMGLARAGFSVTVMTYADAALIPAMQNAGIRIIDFHPEKKFDKEATARIRKELIDGGYHILQLYNSKAYLAGIPAAKGLPVKVVLYRGYQGNLRLLEPGLYFKYFHPRVAKIICNNIGVEEEFRKVPFFNWERKLVTINKGHRPEWYSTVPPADLSPFGVKPESFVLTFIGNVRRMKGLRYLLQAMALLPKGLDLHLLLVGMGMDGSAFRKMAAQSGYGERIHFTGFLPNPLEIDRASDAFVMPSIFGESLTKAVVEAMGVGTAPIVTDIPGNKRLIVHGQSGLMVPPRDARALADAMVQLYSNREATRRMGLEAQKRMAEVLHTERTIAEYAAFYTDLANGHDAYRSKPDVL